MIGLDSSILAAILVFLSLILLLNALLFSPLLHVMRERESRTTGLVAQARKDLDRHLDLFDQFQATIKNARMEGYRHQEQVRSLAMRIRAEALEQAKKSAEQLIQESRAAIETQVEAAKRQLGQEAREIAQGIVTTILQRSA